MTTKREKGFECESMCPDCRHTRAVMTKRYYRCKKCGCRWKI